jgi:hypothetical protein
VDHRVQDYILEKEPTVDPANIGDQVGRGYFPIGVGIALLGAGEWLDNKKMADTGVITLEALFVNVIATEGLKYAVSRKRPNGATTCRFRRAIPRLGIPRLPPGVESAYSRLARSAA